MIFDIFRNSPNVADKSGNPNFHVLKLTKTSNCNHDWRLTVLIPRFFLSSPILAQPGISQREFWESYSLSGNWRLKKRWFSMFDHTLLPMDWPIFNIKPRIFVDLYFVYLCLDKRCQRSHLEKHNCIVNALYRQVSKLFIAPRILFTMLCP